MRSGYRLQQAGRVIYESPIVSIFSTEHRHDRLYFETVCQGVNPTMSENKPANRAQISNLGETVA